MSPVLVDDFVIGAGRGDVTALDRTNGTERWSVDLAYRTDGTPAVDDGQVYATRVTDDGVELAAVDKYDRTIRWTSSPCETTPIVADDIVYTQTFPGDLYALEPR